MLHLELSPDEEGALVRLRDTAPRPYLRERAAALLKVAAGTSASAVARSGLLRPRKPETVAAWVKRYQAAGLAGLVIRPGRGRKPAFSPGPRDRRRGADRPAAPVAPGPLDLWRPPQPVAAGGRAGVLPLAAPAHTPQSRPPLGPAGDSL